MKWLAAALVLVAAPPAHADWEMWRADDASEALDCAAMMLRLEAPDGEALPADFAAASEALRQEVRLSHGESFESRVFADRSAYWDSAEAFSWFGATHARALLRKCEAWVTARGF